MCLTSEMYRPKIGLTRRCLSFVAELLLTLLVCAFLAWLAHPLALPGLDAGLGQRYDISIAPEAWLDVWTSSSDLFARLGDDSRAVLLLRSASVWLPALGLFGLGLLHVARVARSWSSGLLVLLLGVAAAAWRPFGWPVAAGFAGSLVGLCLMLLAMRKGSDVQHDPLSSLPKPASIWSSLVWPGWVLLTGLGWLWIADFAARGPVAAARPGAKYFGLHQADAIFLANALLLLAAARSAFIVQALARLVSALATIWHKAFELAQAMTSAIGRGCGDSLHSSRQPDGNRSEQPGAGNCPEAPAKPLEAEFQS